MSSLPRASLKLKGGRVSPTLMVEEKSKEET